MVEYPQPPIPPGYIEIEFIDENISPVRYYFRDIISYRTTDYRGEPMSDMIVKLDDTTHLTYPLRHILVWKVKKNGPEYIEELRTYEMMLHEQGHPEKEDPDHPGRTLQRFGNCRYCGANPHSVVTSPRGGTRAEFSEQEQELIRRTTKLGPGDAYFPPGVTAPPPSLPTPKWDPPNWPEMPPMQPRHGRSKSPMQTVIDTILGRS